MTYEQTSALLLNMHEAGIDSTQTIIPKYSVLRSAMKSMMRNEHVIPISIIEMDYHELSEDAAANGWLFAIDSVLMQIPGTFPILSQKSTLVLHVDAKNYGDNDLKLKLSAENYFQNHGSMPDEIRIDFADGLGWRDIEFDAVINVHYTTTDIDREIKLEVDRAEETSLAGFARKCHLRCTIILQQPRELA